MACGCMSGVGLVLVFLACPGFRAAPTLWLLLSTALTMAMVAMHTYLSLDVAMRFATSEYLHVDCRLMHARQ
jgi:hypothetical protein